MARHWEDFAVGGRVVSAAVTVTEAHVVGWASLTGDWVPLHVDAEYAARTPFGARIAHGPLTMALALGLVTHTGIFDGGTVAAWLGIDGLRATRPVLLGDTIHAEVEFTGSRPTSNAGRGFTELSYTVLNQRTEPVMTFRSSFLLNRRDSKAASNAEAVG
jgi:acyl dehydratase